MAEDAEWNSSNKSDVVHGSSNDEASSDEFELEKGFSSDSSEEAEFEE